MKALRISTATLGLGLTIVPCVLFFAGSMTQETVKTVMLVGSALWFIAVIPRWDRK
jgi:hypothetical protein